jgi:hypothetical protein
VEHAASVVSEHDEHVPCSCTKRRKARMRVPRREAIPATW